MNFAQELSSVALVWLALFATAMWESRIEGKNAWDKGKFGWKLKIKNQVVLTSYHFWWGYVMIPALLAIPLVLNFSWHLFWILVGAYASGLVIQDFFWYVMNPVLPFRAFYTDFSNYYPWITLKKKKIIPVRYLIGIIITLFSWCFLA